MTLALSSLSILQIVEEDNNTKCSTHYFQTATTSCRVLKYFVKSLPINDEAQRKYIESYGMFQKEGILYRDLLSKLGGADCKLIKEKFKKFLKPKTKMPFQAHRNGGRNVT